MAPPGPAPHPHGLAGDPEIQELIQTVMAARLAKALELDDEQTVLVVRRFSEFREKMSALKRERQELVKQLRMGLREGAPEDELEAKLDELMAHDAEVAEFKRTAYDKASAGLTISQRAKLYVFLSDFESDMRRLIQKARERRAERFGRFPGMQGRRGFQEGPGPRWGQGAEQNPPHPFPGRPPRMRPLIQQEKGRRRPGDPSTPDAVGGRTE